MPYTACMRLNRNLERIMRAKHMRGQGGVSRSPTEINANRRKTQSLKAI